MNDFTAIDRMRQEWSIPVRDIPGHLPVSYATVLRWSRSGRLATRRIGHRLYTSVDALQAACPVTETHAPSVLREQAARDAATRVRELLGARP